MAPRLAEEQAQQANGGRPEGKGTAQPTTAPKPPAVTSTSVAVAPTPAPVLAPPKPEPTSEPVATAPAATATTEPAVVASAPEPVAPAPQKPQTAPEKPPVVASTDKPSGGIEDILFELDSNLLTLTAKGTLDGVVQKLKANPSLRVHVRGHSDQLGSHEHNVELSRRRAAAVENYLLSKGVPSSRISTEAVGGVKPADSTNTPTAWARNRRVEIEWR
ncbi:OmpA family protein [Polyangium aurulentum]|uniref:OmpA family protein n=1 Tax=Polyangium aurulentum TaxID=2567896 RepID=UPI0010ADE134|nr:OmpA family protein [Polyangium aurulentum]UQA55073.1 OmpA family protein [Polyangium aurulentum]